MNIFLKKLVSHVTIIPELDEFDSIHSSIVKDIAFKGTNLWILMFAIIVASVGLNMNSTAVVIGAMLISPLMGPINGMGYSIATYDIALFKRAVKNFSFAVIASLVASTIYFTLSPISTAHSELLARTSPSIYDVLIALFGGLAGIIAISSKQKGNVIPGVAIATALMPPLCTAGYGLATFQMNFFFGAIYLFTINTVFIALASLFVSQLLKFPIRTLVDERKKRRVNRYISTVIAIVFLPSIYFGYTLVVKEKFTENATKYISNVSLLDDIYLLKSDIDTKNESISLVYGGNSMDDETRQSIIDKAKDFNLEQAQILVRQGFTFDGAEEHNAELYKLRLELSSIDTKLAKKQQQIDSIQQQHEMGKIILKEIRTMYPQIQACTFTQGFSHHINKEKEAQQTQIILFSLEGDTISSDNKSIIKNWLKTRLQEDQIRVYYN
ncbi:MAG: TIGR00341 family protein [Paludibacteraceae bacterium]|nr:TIGR00341 family protein [Paludibacteraceae bacterium]